MNKRDRIAVIVSALYSIFLLVLEDNQIISDVPGLMLSLPLIGYWIYRVVVGDISFLPGFLKK